MDQRVRRPQIAAEIRGVGPAEHRVQVGAVVLGVQGVGDGLGFLVQRVERLRIHGRADDGGRQLRTQRLECVSVPQQDVVDCCGRELDVAMAGGMRAGDVALLHRLQGLVDRDPHRRLIANPLGQHVSKLTEVLRGVAIGPAAALLERLRQIPVVDRDNRPDPVQVELFDEPAVIVEPALIHRAAAARQHPRP